MQEKKLYAVILMGEDVNPSRTIAKEIARKQMADGERYLHDLFKFDIELFGKKIGRYYFEAMDKAEKIYDGVPVVADEPRKSSIDEYADGLKKSYHFVQQDENRYKNLLKGIEAAGIGKKIYLSGGDLPQAKSIDERIAEFGELKAVNLTLVKIESFGTFWRSPFFFSNYRFMAENDMLKNGAGASNSASIESLNQGYKEPQDYILDTGNINLEPFKKIKSDTKLSGQMAQLNFLFNILGVALSELSLKDSYALAKEIYAAMRAYKNFKKQHNSMYYPDSAGGDVSRIREITARLLKVPPEEINLKESKNMAFYRDIDSLQDLFRHAKDMYQKKFGITDVKFEDLQDQITYNGKYILEAPEIRKDIQKPLFFFRDLYQKETRMNFFCQHGKGNDPYLQAVLRPAK